MTRPFAVVDVYIKILLSSAYFTKTMNNKSFFCESCSSVFSRKQTLKNHVAKKHAHEPAPAPVEPETVIWAIKLPEGFIVRFLSRQGLDAQPSGFFNYLRRLADNDELFEAIRYDSEWSKAYVASVLRARRQLAA